LKDINAEVNKLERSNTHDATKQPGPTIFDRKDFFRGQTLQPFSKDVLKKKSKGIIPFLD